MKFLIAGAGGVLGRELINILHKRNIQAMGLSYSDCDFNGIRDKLTETLCCDITKPEQLKGSCRGVDIVISTIGITRIRGKKTHMDVDYQGNLNLLKEALESKVKKFVFISPAGVNKGYRYVPLFKAKYMFEEELKKSGINWLIVRSGGFFSDLAEMGKMAQKGSLFVIGRGTNKFTPVHVKDLAEIMVEDALAIDNKVVEVGGPKDMTWKEICNCCFAVAGKKPKIICFPVWLCKIMSLFIKPFSKKYHAMSRLLIFTSIKDLPTARRGKLHFADYLKNHHLLK